MGRAGCLTISFVFISDTYWLATGRIPYWDRVANRVVALSLDAIKAYKAVVKWVVMLLTLLNISCDYEPSNY